MEDMSSIFMISTHAVCTAGCRQNSHFHLPPFNATRVDRHLLQVNQCAELSETTMLHQIQAPMFSIPTKERKEENTKVSQDRNKQARPGRNRGRGDPI